MFNRSYTGSLSKQLQRQLTRFRRLRWLVLIITFACIGSSGTLNVMHAPPNGVAQFVAGIPPVAAFAVIELISKIPVSNIWLSIGRIAGSLVVGGVAAWISYIQQIDYLHRIGYAGTIAAVFPAVIDGTMTVSTLSLVEVVRTLRRLEDAADAELGEQERVAAAAARAMTTPTPSVSVEEAPAPEEKAPEPTPEATPPRRKRKRPPRTTVSPGLKRESIIEATVIEPRHAAVVPAFRGPAMVDTEADMG